MTKSVATRRATWEDAQGEVSSTGQFRHTQPHAPTQPGRAGRTPGRRHRRQIEFLDEHARTAVLAAAQLGCEVAAIANSLVFMADGQPVLVMASGAARVNTQTIAAAVGAQSVTKATADEVRAATGQVIGGVAPTGHPTPLATLVDPDLGLHDTIWAAGGTPDTIVGLTFQQLVVITAGRVTPVR